MTETRQERWERLYRERESLNPTRNEVLSGKRPLKEPPCRHCGHSSKRHTDMGCEGCSDRGRECIGYDPR